MSARTAPTFEQVEALPVRIGLVEACQIALGCGKNKAWELYHAGELPFPAIRVGRRVVVPTYAVKALILGPANDSAAQ
ncbi:DNA-binding protein [Plantactinospora solaniradicis]|uniref:DNA-binding protein n=1 Tax=Plantactinospora solaniradicis TaxID=1723736 RepID=A0ABW1K6Y5_9ACTN